MRKIRVLIVDDSVVIRRILSDIITRDPEMQVVGTAANGRIALSKIQQIKPDLITLDIEMPEMDGLETLTAIRKTYPFLPVIMFSTLTQRGAVATLDALTLGANDYVTKPANIGSVTAAMQSVHDDLIPKIKVFCSKILGPEKNSVQPEPSRIVIHPDSEKPKSRHDRVDILAIGVSTGGPAALSLLIPALPKDFPVPIVIVQHMPPIFTKYLAERLSSLSAIIVNEGTSGTNLQPGQAWVAPGNYHMALTQKSGFVTLQTHQGPPENSCRPAVDVLFRSVAEVYGPHTLAVVMTGMGQDGLRGCEDIHRAGGNILIQDEASSIVWGMPGFIAKAGLADKVLPLGQLAQAIIQKVKEGRNVRASVA